MSEEILDVEVYTQEEADRTEDEVGDLFRNERHIALKMQKPLFVSSLSSDQKSRIDALNVSL